VDGGDPSIAAALRGENPMVIARMPSGSAVIGDTQHLPGYSLLLCDDESVNHLTDLDWERRKVFLFDLSLIGEAVQAACRDNGLRRINYGFSATPCRFSTVRRQTSARWQFPRHRLPA
jgi:diadenosine tetraphosphate (Ap4A) HIT family hydrolase